MQANAIDLAKEKNTFPSYHLVASGRRQVQQKFEKYYWKPVSYVLCCVVLCICCVCCTVAHCFVDATSLSAHLAGPLYGPCFCVCSHISDFHLKICGNNALLNGKFNAFFCSMLPKRQNINTYFTIVVNKCCGPTTATTTTKYTFLLSLFECRLGTCSILFYGNNNLLKEKICKCKLYKMQQQKFHFVSFSYFPLNSLSVSLFLCPLYNAWVKTFYSSFHYIPFYLLHSLVKSSNYIIKMVYKYQEFAQKKKKTIFS